MFNDPSSESDDEDDPELWADPIAPVDPVPGPGPNTRAHRARDREDRRRVRFDRRNRKRAMDPLKDLVSYH